VKGTCFGAGRERSGFFTLGDEGLVVGGLYGNAEVEFAREEGEGRWNEGDFEGDFVNSEGAGLSQSDDVWGFEGAFANLEDAGLVQGDEVWGFEELESVVLGGV
jgi:hypothetical protein